MSLFDEWHKNFMSLEKKIREGDESHKGLINYSLEEAIPHLDRDLGWLLRKLPDNQYAKMEVDRIKNQIMGMVISERKLAVENYKRNINKFKKFKK